MKFVISIVDEDNVCLIEGVSSAAPHVAPPQENIADWVACKQLCIDTENCKFFLYKAAWSKCWLKGTDNNLVHGSVGFVFGSTSGCGRTQFSLNILGFLYFFSKKVLIYKFKRVREDFNKVPYKVLERLSADLMFWPPATEKASFGMN